MSNLERFDSLLEKAEIKEENKEFTALVLDEIEKCYDSPFELTHAHAIVDLIAFVLGLAKSNTRVIYDKDWKSFKPIQIPKLKNDDVCAMFDNIRNVFSENYSTVRVGKLKKDYLLHVEGVVHREKE